MSNTKKIIGAVMALGLIFSIGLTTVAPQSSCAVYAAPAILQEQDSSQLIANARTQRIVIPDGFIPTAPVYGSMYNESGSVYYAVYKFRDPNYASSPEYRFGTFVFPNVKDPATAQYDGSVVLYGYWNGLGLFEHMGEIFWANPMYFHSNNISDADVVTQKVQQMAASQGVELPKDFVAIEPIYGSMYNDTGSEYYAVLQYKDYTRAGERGQAFGTFAFRNTANNATANNDGNCTVYGYYMGYGLYEHYGMLFWAKPTYFHSQQLTAAKDFVQLKEAAALQGVVIPENFSPIAPYNGKMYNDQGTQYYAVYKYMDPNKVTNDQIIDSFWFPNSTNPLTVNCDANVRIYGYMNGYGLFEHYGELFWASSEYFHAG